MSDDDPRAADVVRRVLADRAAGVQPAGDGLERIRTRTRIGTRPRPRRLLLRPPVVAAAALTLLAAAGTTALLLRDQTAVVSVAQPPSQAPPPPPPASSAASSPSPTPARTSRTSVAPGPSTPVAPSPAGPVATIWPFGSLSAAASDPAAAGSYRDPVDTAQRFVRDFLSFPEVDRVVASQQRGTSATVTLGRVARDGGQVVPVTTVTLLRAGTGGPFVVRSAAAPGLSLTTPSAGAAVGSPVRVTGTARSGADPLRVEVFGTGGTQAAGTATTGGAAPAAWSTTVAYAGVAGPGAVVAEKQSAGTLAGIAEIAATPVTLR